MTSDYRHVNQFVDRGRRIKRRHILRGDPDGSFARRDLPLLRHPRQGVRFVRLLREFRRHYEAFKHECLLTSQAEAIRVAGCVRSLQPATNVIRCLAWVIEGAMTHAVEGVR